MNIIMIINQYLYINLQESSFKHSKYISKGPLKPRFYDLF